MPVVYQNFNPPTLPFPTLESDYPALQAFQPQGGSFPKDQEVVEEKIEKPRKKRGGSVKNMEAASRSTWIQFMKKWAKEANITLPNAYGNADDSRRARH